VANLVNIESVGKAYGTRTLLDGVSLGLAEGDRIGVVGRNGGGKSTLLKLLAKLEQPDSGRVVHSGNTHLVVVGQHDELDPDATIRAQLLGGRPTRREGRLEARHRVSHDAPDEVFLRGEVVVERRDIHADGRGHLARP